MSFRSFFPVPRDRRPNAQKSSAVGSHHTNGGGLARKAARATRMTNDRPDASHQSRRRRLDRFSRAATPYADRSSGTAPRTACDSPASRGTRPPASTAPDGVAPWACRATRPWRMVRDLRIAGRYSWNRRFVRNGWTHPWRKKTNKAVGRGSTTGFLYPTFDDLPPFDIGEGGE